MIYIENKKKVDRHIIGQLRNFLGLVMMYLFFTSIMGAKGGRKGAGGKSAFGMQDQSKSKRFLQPVNVKFNDVVGMQKAK
jgi:ATP-dependent Zn protease